jgi:hypothetical protein
MTKTRKRKGGSRNGNGELAAEEKAEVRIEQQAEGKVEKIAEECVEGLGC